MLFSLLPFIQVKESLLNTKASPLIFLMLALSGCLMFFIGIFANAGVLIGLSSGVVIQSLLMLGQKTPALMKSSSRRLARLFPIAVIVSAIPVALPFMFGAQCAPLGIGLFILSWVLSIIIALFSGRSVGRRQVKDGSQTDIPKSALAGLVLGGIFLGFMGTPFWSCPLSTSGYFINIVSFLLISLSLSVMVENVRTSTRT